MLMTGRLDDYPVLIALAVSTKRQRDLSHRLLQVFLRRMKNFSKTSQRYLYALSDTAGRIFIFHAVRHPYLINTVMTEVSPDVLSLDYALQQHSTLESVLTSLVRSTHQRRCSNRLAEEFLKKYFSGSSYQHLVPSAVSMCKDYKNVRLQKKILLLK
jgi:hypothetical protein